jgi:hypothetical protein
MHAQGLRQVGQLLGRRQPEGRPPHRAPRRTSRALMWRSARRRGGSAPERAPRPPPDCPRTQQPASQSSRNVYTHNQAVKTCASGCSSRVNGRRARAPRHGSRAKQAAGWWEDQCVAFIDSMRRSWSRFRCDPNGGGAQSARHFASTRRQSGDPGIAVERARGTSMPRKLVPDAEN